MTPRLLSPAISLIGLTAASCSPAPAGDKPASSEATRSADAPFRIEVKGAFDEPWDITFDEGTGTLFVTERKGAIRFLTADGKPGRVSGVPQVDYGGQGGLGDLAFAPGTTSSRLDRRVVYLSWVEAGAADTRGAVVGRADMVCEAADLCSLNGLNVIWRQTPKVSGRGHFSHRIAFSADGAHLFIASGDRQKMTPAQDTGNTLGKIVRLLPEGAPAPGNPLAGAGSPADQIWTWGHRNVLALKFDPQGRLWDLEHGPAGGDELNLVKPGANYGWPLVSEGDHYDGRVIPPHASRPQFAAPALSWNPVIAPGDMIFYTGQSFADWQGQALIAAMKPAGLVRVAIEGGRAREIARYPTRNRVRSIAQAPDGAIWIVEDGKDLRRARLLRLTPAD